MKISVYDTYVRNNNAIMHFDILIEEDKTEKDALVFGEKYLKSKGIDNKTLTTKECKFCHIETAPEAIEKMISKNGYYILEMENC
jgi:hypothetical protein